jgi:NAD(P)-dependent dehydrogenase (short-subunit alcohol dehydrogenase family)
MMASAKTVVVTGAGSGIGQALAIGFAADGYTVVGVGRTAATLEATGRLCAPNSYTYRLVDVADAAAVQRVFAAIEAEVAPIDALINNSAVYPRLHFLDQSAEDWTNTILINICGVANCCRAVLPGMLERNLGRIVNIGSLADMYPIPGACDYSVSKGGLHALTKALAVEISPERYPNVLVNEMFPGATRTQMSDYGNEVSAIYPWVKRLVELPSGGATGRMFQGFKEIRLNESLKGKIKRILLRR